MCEPEKELLDITKINCYTKWDARNVLLPDNSIHMIITSPPYNVGVNYNEWNDQLPLHEYMDFTYEWIKESHRVLVEGGRLAVVIANVGRKPYINNTSIVDDVADEAGFTKRGEIIWVKGKSPNSTAWGSYMKASNPSLRDAHEYILIYHKGSAKRPDEGTSTIDGETFRSCSNSVWVVNPITKARAYGHPAAFPVEIPRRLIEFYSYKEDIIFDPFCGSGTTCRAAQEAGRRWIGSDLDLSYIEKQENIEKEKREKSVKPSLFPVDRPRNQKLDRVMDEWIRKDLGLKVAQPE